jgi:hypothetical protein
VEPSARLGEAIRRMEHSVRSAIVSTGESPDAALLHDLRSGWGGPGIDRLVHRTLRSAVEHRRARSLAADAPP